MIVIAIIAVIAAIAIPSLLRNKLEANQTAAVASMRAIAAGQTLWHKNDYDKNNTFDYTADYSQLYYAEVEGETVKIIDKALADARGTAGAGIAKSGYFIGDLTTGANGTAYDVQYEYGLCAWPGAYNRSGLQTFVIDTTGSVYQKDLGSAACAYFTDFPDIATWMLVH
jgi:type II secretory pathway pseudopilin PulG